MNELGFALSPSVIDPDLLVSLEAALANVEADANVRSRGNVYAIRHLLTAAPAIRNLAEAGLLSVLARSVLGDAARPVRGLFFDKRPEANWLVPWHQDLTICVKKRRDVEGFGPWTVKAGVVHVQPPAYILEQMVALRIHLDDAPTENGALRVMPGTHRLGRLAASEITRLVLERGEETCATSRGEILLMKPLLLHASSAAVLPARRRVIHIEYAAVALPEGLEWHEEPSRS